MKTLPELQQDLDMLTQELDRAITLASRTNVYNQRLQHATSGHVLGHVTLADLQRAQADYDEAIQALSRRDMLQQAVAEAKRNLDYAISQERKQFIDGIHSQFQDVRERYITTSKALLELFREMHRLHIQSQSMRSHELLSPSDYRLDLPAIRRSADSELFTIAQMMRDGSY